jgi:signal peptidase I
MKQKGFISTMFLVIIAVIVVTVRFIIGFNYYSMPSSSMEPSLHSGGHMLVFQPIYCFGGCQPHAGEMWIFNGEGGIHFVKRLVALPGDTVEMVGDALKVNGTLMPAEEAPIPTALQEILKANETNPDDMLLRTEHLGGNTYQIFARKNGAIGNFGPIKLGQDRYFFLGDFRSRSKDSRFDNGPIGAAKKDLVGKVIHVF